MHDAARRRAMLAYERPMATQFPPTSDRLQAPVTCDRAQDDSDPHADVPCTD